MTTPDEIWIANRATYWPVAPIDLVVGAPLVVRALLGVTPIGRVVQGAVLGAYLANAVRDWHDRRGIRKIDFRREFGADVHHLVPMPREVREAEVRMLAERLKRVSFRSDAQAGSSRSRSHRHLTRYIASITGSWCHERRGARLRPLKLAVPVRARGVRRAGRVISRSSRTPGPSSPRPRARVQHRKGSWKELHAQALAYLAMVTSGEPVLRQAARLERFYRHLCVLAGKQGGAFDRLAGSAALRPELGKVLGELRPPAGAVARKVEAGMRQVYDTRMRMTGQAGISDYELGFTNFLYTFQTSTTARQTPPGA